LALALTVDRSAVLGLVPILASNASSSISAALLSPRQRLGFAPEVDLLNNLLNAFLTSFPTVLIALAVALNLLRVLWISKGSSARSYAFFMISERSFSPPYLKKVQRSRETHVETAMRPKEMRAVNMVVVIRVEGP
jgi:hypothetical protein